MSVTPSISEIVIKRPEVLADQADRLVGEILQLIDDAELPPAVVRVVLTIVERQYE